MIHRLLIANRGEIAVRIARTARRLGIGTVGIYSEPDRGALHVDCVDLAVALGGSSPADSYLCGEAVLRAAVDTGCDAVHPGYGFLAENADFARSVVDAGLIWVGPTPEQIALLGDKVAAKKAAIEAGVPTTPIHGAAPGSIPVGLAMPVIVKAAAGGGGRGMRVVREESELADAVESAAREAESAFGDGSVFIEPYIEHGHHVEVQVMGDRHGNVLHFGERECSIQRRNQKIIEETPSPSISETTRRALWEGALALARHVGYESAGTVEFLVGDDGTIDFLEVNTRLQVEHPVTEAAYDVDLVELQLRVAAGEPLTIEQDDIRLHQRTAIEVRIVAEDPAAGWLPSTGEVTSFEIGDVARVDTGVRRGSVVSPDYDSLLAKVIAHGTDRAGVAANLARTLVAADVSGVRTNVDTLVAILGEPDFLAGRTPTSYLDDHADVLTARGPEGDDRLALLLAAVLAAEALDRAEARVWGFAPSGWRNVRTQGQRQIWIDERTDERHAIEYVTAHSHPTGPASHEVSAPSERRNFTRSFDVRVGPFPVPTDDGSLTPDERRRISVRLVERDDPHIAIEVDGHRRLVSVDNRDGSWHTRSPVGVATWRLAPRFADHTAELVGSGPV
ncbi:MAG TPA: biotin carboxylase N-terminal domain-containing protein, partial [Ilumatobacteraceae bacterium]|nr:biotin carboxylase N-terminal domain-containing protein [Ilumatobacteraceae bacterium]